MAEETKESSTDSKEKIKYKNFILDQFQVDAIHSIEKNHSVVVSAATGTGKTLIADYAINKFMAINKRVIYTAPIKALSNQKYRDFKAEYGEENVGIMTGDVVQNPNAPLLIMTTEIYRNMLLTKDPIVDSISYIVFDEIHFMSDPERGTIWEESIIFSPPHVRFLCLSATIPNARIFADWIQAINKHTVDVVTNTKRAVPLEHFIYDIDYGVITIEHAHKLQLNHEMPDYYKVMRRQRQKGRHDDKPKVPMHYDLVRALMSDNSVPCIFFVFSRAGCEDKAKELAMRNDFLNNEQKQHVLRLFNEKVHEAYRNLESVHLMKNVLQRGIGLHHAGLLPSLKEVVEILFAEGMIKVLYATETFAVGINMPAKTVCFNSLVKYDGRGFGFLKSRDYFQMAGRAGRRGIDLFGKAISLLERRSELGKIVDLVNSESEPIISQFQLGPNTVLNMINNHKPDEIQEILRKNFDYFIRKRADEEMRIQARYNNLVKRLTKLEYIGYDGILTQKGRFATKIYSNELLVTELFFGDLYKELSNTDICTIIGAIVYEPRRNDEFFISKYNNKYQALVQKMMNSEIIKKEFRKDNLRKIWTIVNRWANGCKFSDLMELSNYQEGDYIRFYRQIVDCMSQIKNATEDYELKERITSCMNLIYRDVIRFEF